MSRAGTSEDAVSPQPQQAQPLRSAGSVGRPVKACKACRATKIKCKMNEGVPPCERCHSKSITCQVEQNAPSTLDEANRRLAIVTGQVAQLQTAVNILLRTSNLPMLSSYSQSSDSRLDFMGEDEAAGEEDGDGSLPAGPILTPVPTEDDSVYALPINSLYEVTRIPSLRNPTMSSGRQGTVSADLISRGAIPEAVANKLFIHFKTKLDPLCYGILCPHDSLNSLRKSSALLTASICAVASLHDSEGTSACRVCHAEFLRLVTSTIFSVSHSMDDVRALIVGALWLSNVSYFLIGHVIRLAMRLDYHTAYYQVVSGNHRSVDVDKARLWYLLYILDHHSSILYGRPALIASNEEPYQQWEHYIQVNQYSQPDLRLCSQVALFHIIAKVKDVFRGYTNTPVPDHCLPQLQNYFVDLDRWYMVWGNRMSENVHVGYFPRDGALMHYHFARLHLCSYIFRGMPLDVLASASTQVREYAALAVSSATAALELMLDRDALRNNLVGMHLYFHGMITFAAVFLIKAAVNNLNIVAAPQVFDLVRRCVQQLRSQPAARQHLVYHLSNGLEDMMMADSVSDSSVNVEKNASEAQQPMQAPEPPTMDSMFALNSLDLLQIPMTTQNGNPSTNSDGQWDLNYEMEMGGP